MTKLLPAFEMGFGNVARVGCCALVAVMQGSTLWVANAGDCAAVLGRRRNNKANAQLASTAISNGGAVVSEPGALSQKIHADTPHLFEDIHCAPHYINLFLPVVEKPSDTKVGQTGFFVGTHKLECF